jgi:hypothetical protein
MRRMLTVMLFLLLSGPAPAVAQRVRLVVADTINARGQRLPLVFTPGILRDERWLESLRNSFPLRMEFRVEIWRVRPDWFDRLERWFEWEIVVQFEPLTDQYTKSEAWGGALRRQTTFGSLPELERNLEVGHQIGISPSDAGEYYFTATLRLSTLTDEEMEELERFLQGDPTPAERERGSVLSRAARRILLRFGGLPYDQLEGRSRRFQVGTPPPTDELR